MSLAIAFALSALLYIATVLSHYEALRLISQWVEHSRLRPRARMLLVLFGIVLAHVIEIGLYAVALWYAHRVLGIGGFTGASVVDASSYFYFSAETFTSLGMGDLFATGPLRLIASLEVLNGLILIGWSTSFAFLAMSRLWELHQPGSHLSSCGPTADRIQSPSGGPRGAPRTGARRIDSDQSWFQS
jgi:hypothetical protein